MSAQDLILGARVAHLGDLKREVERLKAENSSLRAECDSLRAHFDLALIAAETLKAGKMEVWDGWNLILGAQRSAVDREDLIAQAKARLSEDSELSIWIVFDGQDERVINEGRLRISYTGGVGAHRADRFITDFVRMAAYLGLTHALSVRTNDKDFRRQVARLMV